MSAADIAANLLGDALLKLTDARTLLKRASDYTNAIDTDDAVGMLDDLVSEVKSEAEKLA